MMTPPDSERRIDAALKLAPMSVNTLSRCLMLSHSTVRRVLSELESCRRVVRCRTRDRSRRMGLPGYVYERRA